MTSDPAENGDYQATLDREARQRRRLPADIDLPGDLVCPLFTATPVTAHWGARVRLQATSGSFGARPPGQVWLLAGQNPLLPASRTELTPTSWQAAAIEATLPASAPAGGPPFWLQAPLITCAPLLVTVLDPGDPVACPLYTTWPSPANWGRDLFLRTTLGGSFGTSRGSVTLRAGSQSRALDVKDWRETEIRVGLPPTAPFGGPYTVSARIPALNRECPGPPTVLIVDLPRVLKLTLKRLSCRTPEDWTGPDECRLVLSVKGVPVRSEGHHHLDNGETWTLGWELKPFLVNAKVELWDEDLGYWPDPHDFLGSHEIRPVAVADGRARFTGDGADYTLYYSVESVLA